MSLHTGWPVPHVVVPTWHGLDEGTQTAFGVHVAQVPAEQKRLAPQGVPSGAVEPVSVQTGEPLVQSIVPVWQTFVGVQAPPEAHASAPESPQIAPVAHTCAEQHSPGPQSTSEMHW